MTPASGKGNQHGSHDHPPVGGHHHDRGIKRFWSSLLRAHRHDTGFRVDRGLETSSKGIRAVKVSLVALTLTALLQLAVVLASGSVALLSDTLHNVADALTSLPLWLAFVLARRSANRTYTYGYGRAEDLAGVLIVVVIASSAAVAGYQAVHRLLHPQPIDNLGLVMAASVIGFVGNELVAVFRIRVGREIGSAALVADGVHSRTDGLTSLAVLLGALGVAAGYPLADPLVGIAITVAIVIILKDAARDVYMRLMDAVDPSLVKAVEDVVGRVGGVRAVDSVGIRWIGHRLRAEVEITVDRDLTVEDGHDIAVAAHHELLHAIPALSQATVHTNPTAQDADPHAAIAHHFRR